MVVEGFEVVVVDEQIPVVDVRSEVVVVDLKSPVASHPCLNHGDCEVVSFLVEVLKVFLPEVNFEGACGGKKDLSIGCGEGVLSFWFSLLDVSRLA
ncbi:hypothetical protein Tco_1112311 [Tanacetum coccineum]|uniref:Uncharacterized protein n=1 Tax=Tanacetum coccineum TaxID=301880 RepID=A0ABQ5IP81_9ASTR